MRMKLLVIACVSLIGCDDAADVERHALSTMEAQNRRSPDLCAQAKRLRAVASDRIQAQYVINTHCPKDDPAVDAASRDEG